MLRLAMRHLSRTLVIVALTVVAVRASFDTPFFRVRHAASTHWSRNCPSPAALGWQDDSRFYGNGKLSCCCSILDYGAVGDNSTLNTIQIQSTIDGCHDVCFLDTNLSGQQTRIFVVYVPKGMFRTGSLSLRSNMRFHIARGGSIYGSDEPQDYPLVPRVVANGKRTIFRALLSGSDLQNISITGEDYGYQPGSFRRFSSHGSATIGRGRNDTFMSVIDGVGWKWWCKARSFPIPQSYCQYFNPKNETLPKEILRPKMIELFNCTNIVLDRFTAQNSPFYFVHPVESRNIIMTNLTLLAPREVGNTDGLDPESSENVLIDTCYIDVGDDGVSIKSSNHSGKMVPTRNVTMRNLRIVSRNWCIGSGTFGGINDILFEDSTIGDLETVTSPWAIKFKSHQNYPGPIENITIRRIEIGHIGATPWMYPTAPGIVLIVRLSYNHRNSKLSGKPIFRNVTFEDITAASAGEAGAITGFPENCLEGLTLKNITVSGGKVTWVCNNVDLDSLTISDVHPPLTCKDECGSRPNASLALNSQPKMEYAELLLNTE